MSMSLVALIGLKKLVDFSLGAIRHYCCWCSILLLIFILIMMIILCLVLRYIIPINCSSVSLCVSILQSKYTY